MIHRKTKGRNPGFPGPIRTVKNWMKAHSRPRETSQVPDVTSRAARYALRFFALMVLLTLIARGTSGASMARVKLRSAGAGVIVQQETVNAQLLSRQGETMPLPEGVTVEYLAVSQGQNLRAGDTILQLNPQELQDALDAAKALLGQQKAQYATLVAGSPADDSGVTSAQTALERAQQDSDGAARRAQISVDDAAEQQQKAQQAYEQAVQTLRQLQSQPLPSATPEQAQRGQQIEQAQEQVDAAASALDSADKTLRDARLSQEDALLSAQRSVEDARAALGQAETAYDQAKQSADLSARSGAADAAALALTMRSTEEQIAQLESLLKSSGLVTAAQDTQILLCSLQQGQPCPSGPVLRLADETGQWVVQFSLPEEEAARIAAGQAVTVRQNQRSAQTTVQTVAPADESGNCLVTALLPRQEEEAFSADAAVRVEILFSRNEYGTCLPASAIRQDSTGSFVLTVEQSRTAFGVTNLAVRVPVTVLEVDSAGEYAAVAESVAGQVIVSSDRAVSPGAAVRIES